MHIAIIEGKNKEEMDIDFLDKDEFVLTHLMQIHDACMSSCVP